MYMEVWMMCCGRIVEGFDDDDDACSVGVAIALECVAIGSFNSGGY